MEPEIGKYYGVDDKIIEPINKDVKFFDHNLYVCLVHELDLKECCWKESHQIITKGGTNWKLLSSSFVKTFLRK